MRFFRIYYEVRGGYTHTRWFSGGNPRAVMGKCGELTFLNGEWESLRELLRHSAVEILAEGEVPSALREAVEANDAALKALRDKAAL